MSSDLDFKKDREIPTGLKEGTRVEQEYFVMVLVSNAIFKLKGFVTTDNVIDGAAKIKPELLPYRHLLEVKYKGVIIKGNLQQLHIPTGAKLEVVTASLPEF